MGNRPAKPCFGAMIILAFRKFRAALTIITHRVIQNVDIQILSDKVSKGNLLEVRSRAEGSTIDIDKGFVAKIDGFLEGHKCFVNMEPLSPNLNGIL